MQGRLGVVLVHIGLTFVHVLDFVLVIVIFETFLDHVPIFIFGLRFLHALVVRIVYLWNVRHVHSIVLLISIHEPTVICLSPSIIGIIIPIVIIVVVITIIVITVIVVIVLIVLVVIPEIVVVVLVVVVFIVVVVIVVVVVGIVYSTVVVVGIKVVVALVIILDIFTKENDLVGVKLLVILVLYLLDHFAHFGLLVYFYFGYSILEAPITVPIYVSSILPILLIRLISLIKKVIFNVKSI